MTELRTFLAALWPADVPEGEHIVLTTQRPGAGMVSAHYATTDELADALDATELKDRHAWLNVATRAAGTERRGGLADCRTLPAVWMDLDVAEDAAPGAHKDTAKVVPTFADAWELIDRFPMAPTVVVNTGNGLQAWWMLTEPVDATAGAELLSAFAATARRITNGLADDVWNLDRMMRLPGTFNVKGGECRPVTIVRHNSAARYDAAELLEEYLDAPAEEMPAAEVPEPIDTDATAPGALYDARATVADVEELLKAAGCTKVRTDRDGSTYWTRPGKDAREGHSIQVGGADFTPTTVTVHSTGWAALPEGTYTPFGLLARLQFARDFSAAARHLRAQGFTADPITPATFVPALNDADMADAFARTTHGRLLHVAGVGWMAWGGRRLVPITEGVLLVRLSQFVKSVIAAVETDTPPADADKDAKADRDRRLKAAHGYLRVGARRNLIAEAAGHLETPADELDATPGLLNTPTGIVNLATGALLPHDPAHRMTKITRAEYHPGATSADWTKALAGLATDVADYLQVALGAAIIGSPEADRIHVAHGSGGNGKTTILGSAEHSLGDYAVSIPAKVFTGGGDGPRENQLLMPLRGARLALAAETGEDHYLNMERLKAISGGDVMTDRNLYAKEWAHWRPTHTLFLMTNYRPRVRNSDEGTWRRLRLIPFTSSFVREKDTGLRERLKSPEVSTAVLAWMVAGARRWMATKEMPASLEVERATETWRDEEDIIAAFFTEAGYIVTGNYAGDVMRADELYKGHRHGYRSWADGAGRKMMSGATFKAELDRYAARLDAARRPSLRYQRTKTGGIWKGLRLAATDELAALDADTTPPAEGREEFPW